MTAGGVVDGIVVQIARGPSRVITGVVLDEAGRSVPGVTFTVSHSAPELERRGGTFLLWREPDLQKVRVATLWDLERELESLRERVRVPGLSAAIAEDGRILWARGFGFADVERPIPAGADTIYHLASVTKPFGATVVLQLAEEGRLSLDAPVSKFGIQMERSGPVRVWHLLSHTGTTAISSSRHRSFLRSRSGGSRSWRSPTPTA